MGMIRNLLALVGLACLIGAGWAYSKVAPVIAEFDPGYQQTYLDFAKTLLETGDPGTAMVWSVPVQEGLSPEDVEESLKSLAAGRDFLFVGKAPFYKQVEEVTEQPYRYIAFLSFCDAGVGKMMADHNNAYTAFMPCRISVVEDKEGKLWLHSMNLDMMIHGGKRLPEELRNEALRVRNVIWDIMHGAARGDF